MILHQQPYVAAPRQRRNAQTAVGEQASAQIIGQDADGLAHLDQRSDDAQIVRHAARALLQAAFPQKLRLRDFALVWAEEGLEAVRKVAKKSPEAFVAIAARICPNDVRLTLEQAIPGGMSLEDDLLMRQVIAAIRECLLEADQLQPGAVFQHVLEALHDCSKNN